ncbi:hypothetical protein JOF53_000283 [Crossiella equi]|uniref:Peptidase S1 domain-containing protein n=1 Tax=Crossiella equi TaxID=130796 RepID=A0ABM6RLB2_9PSEU|nr:trypsin-like serine protease [Crossiella equi]MBP2471411.1 hypothetical protein [Crossiella equi]
MGLRRLLALAVLTGLLATDPGTANAIVGGKETRPQEFPCKVGLPVLPNGQCAETDPGVVCTYAPGKDTCALDSGGPLVLATPASHVLVGVISANSGCANGEPSRHTRVSHYLDWIRSVTPARRPAPPPSASGGA